MLCGRPAAIVGHRRDKRELLCFTALDKGGFGCQIIDTDVGPANIWHDTVDGKEILISANREIDEVALYKVTEK